MESTKLITRNSIGEEEIRLGLLSFLGHKHAPQHYGLYIGQSMGERVSSSEAFHQDLGVIWYVKPVIFLMPCKALLCVRDKEMSLGDTLDIGMFQQLNCLGIRENGFTFFDDARLRNSYPPCRAAVASCLDGHIMVPYWAQDSMFLIGQPGGRKLYISNILYKDFATEGESTKKYIHCQETWEGIIAPIASIFQCCYQEAVDSFAPGIVNTLIKMDEAAKHATIGQRQDMVQHVSGFLRNLCRQLWDMGAYKLFDIDRMNGELMQQKKISEETNRLGINPGDVDNRKVESFLEYLSSREELLDAFNKG